MNIEITAIRQANIARPDGVVVAEYNARVGDFRITCGTVLLTHAGELRVSVGKQGSLYLPTHTQTRRDLRKAALDALEGIVNV